MPKKKTKTTTTSKQRAKVKKLGAAKDLSAAEAKKVKGGVAGSKSSIKGGPSVGIHFKIV